MRSENLLALARDLARRETGKPKSVSLRRAASTSYYALFHALARPCADRLVGQQPWHLYVPVYRALDHRKTLDALRSHGGSLATTAVLFKTLQDKRNEADYSPEPFLLSRRDTLGLIGAAERAIAALETLSSDEKLALSDHARREVPLTGRSTP